MTKLSSKLRLVETICDKIVLDTPTSELCKAAENVNAAATVLQWTRFVMPLVDELELIAPKYDFQQVEANGFRSLLAILSFSVDAMMDRVEKRQLRAISQSELRAYAQSCELALMGLIMREYTVRFGSQTELIPPAEALAHPCYQLIAAQCNAELDARQYAHAKVTFGYSKALQSVLRLVSAATVAMHDADQHFLQVQQSLARASGQATEVSAANGRDVKPLQDQQLSKESVTAANKLLRTALKVAEKLSWCNVVLSHVVQTFLLWLPVRSIEHKRVERAAAVTQQCEVQFIQRCWNLSELPLVHFCEKAMSAAVSHSELLTVQLPGTEMRVQVRILCAIPRRASKRPKTVVLHAHGGGFVAHTSKSHESYLRRIANELRTVVLSVDYSTAPQSSFPRPVDECYAVYRWLLAPAGGRERLCSSCEQVYMVGDSAGGNLLLSVMQRATLDGLRMPSGFLGVYTPMVLQFAPSPSRMTTLVDPLVSSRTLAACLLAYFGRPLQSTLNVLEQQCEQHTSQPVRLCEPCQQMPVAARPLAQWLCQLSRLRAPLFSRLAPPGCSRAQYERTSCALVKLQSFTASSNCAVSDSSRSCLRNNEQPTSAPLLWPDSVLLDLPPVALITPGVLDPTIDDNVQFAKRLAALNKCVTLDAVQNVPHGFLNFANVCPYSARGLQLCIARLRDMMQAAED